MHSCKPCTCNGRCRRQSTEVTTRAPNELTLDSNRYRLSVEARSSGCHAFCSHQESGILSSQYSRYTDNASPRILLRPVNDLLPPVTRYMLRTSLVKAHRARHCWK